MAVAKPWSCAPAAEAFMLRRLSFPSPKANAAKASDNVNGCKKREPGAGSWLLTLALVWLAVTGTARAVSIDPSHRYYQDGNGNPVFLMGYYDWAAVPDGYFIDHPSRYSVMLQKGAPYKLN